MTAESVHYRLRLPALLERRIRRHARQEFPAECCGVLLGTRRHELATVVAVRPGANVAGGDRVRCFELDPRDLVKALREGRGRDLDLLGFYHSHPHGHALPSPGDLRQGWPGTSTIVLPMSAHSCGSPRSFRLVGDGRAVEEMLEKPR